MRKFRAFMAVILVMLMASSVASAQEQLDKMYGGNLHVNMEGTLPVLQKVENKYTIAPYMPSPENIKSHYNILSEESNEDVGGTSVTYTYNGEGFRVITSTVGNFVYWRDDYSKYSYLFYSCVDAQNQYDPSLLITDYSELEFMTAEEAAKTAMDELAKVMPDVCSSFDMECSVYPMHSEDMQRAVESEIADLSQEDIDFYKRKYGIYDGCIAADDDCYVVVVNFSKDGIPLFDSHYYHANGMNVDGMGIYMLIDANGIVMTEVNGMLYRISETRAADAQSKSCEEWLESTGKFFDNIIGIEAMEINDIDVCYMPVAVSQGKYELVQVLELSSYDAERERNVRAMIINTESGELYF